MPHCPGADPGFPVLMLQVSVSSSEIAEESMYLIGLLERLKEITKFMARINSQLHFLQLLLTLFSLYGH